jgi:hypothetical protein
VHRPLVRFSVLSIPNLASLVNRANRANGARPANLAKPVNRVILATIAAAMVAARAVAPQLVVRVNSNRQVSKQDSRSRQDNRRPLDRASRRVIHSDAPGVIAVKIAPTTGPNPWTRLPPSNRSRPKQFPVNAQNAQNAMNGRSGPSGSKSLTGPKWLPNG